STAENRKPSKPRTAPDLQSQTQGDLSTIAGSGQENTGEAFVDAKTTVNKERMSMLPALTAEQIELREELEQEAVPVPQGAPTRTGPISPALEPARSQP